MRAFHVTAPGELELRDMPMPVPGPGEVVLGIRAALTCGTDLKLFRRGHPKMPFPTRMGHEFAGVVVAAGSGARFAEGDEVMSVHTAPCGTCGLCLRGAENLCDQAMSSMTLGGFADLLLLPRPVVDVNAFRKPASLAWEHAAFLEPLKGRRIYYPSRTDDMPGAGPLERAYTLIVTPDGEVLHLNRFLDTAWSPAEVRCARRLMAEVQPGLTFDLHEHGGDSFWMSARRQRTDDDEVWERRIASEAIRAVAASGTKLAPEDYSPGSFFQRLERGVYWLDAGQRGEGLNLVDFAARQYGLGFTIETGMRGPFHDRVRQHLLVVQTAVKLFEERYA